MKTFTASEFKARALEIIKDVSGSGEPVLVTLRGKALVRVECVVASSGRLNLGSLIGAMTIHGDICWPRV